MPSKKLLASGRCLLGWVQWPLEALFDELLELLQVLANLRRGILTEPLDDGRRNFSTRRAVLQPHAHTSSATRAGSVEVDRAGAHHIRTFDRLPANHLIRHLIDDLGVPFDDGSGWSSGAPARQRVGDAFDRFQVLHETR